MVWKKRGKKATWETLSQSNVLKGDAYFNQKIEVEGNKEVEDIAQFDYIGSKCFGVGKGCMWG